MPPELIAVTEGPSILLDKPIVLLGRHQECDVQLNSSKVSRRHCCIAQVEDYLVIRDLQSTNGIRINGEKVIEGRLKDGDELTVADFQFRVRWPDPSRPNSNGSQHRPPAPRAPRDEDEALESSDEPVPLNESAAGDAPAYQAQPFLDADHPPEHPSHPSNPDDQPPSLILPDNLELAQSSDIWPKPE